MTTEKKTLAELAAARDEASLAYDRAMLNTMRDPLNGTRYAALSEAMDIRDDAVAAHVKALAAMDDRIREAIAANAKLEVPS